MARRQTLRLILDLSRTAQEVEVSQSTFRQLIYFRDVDREIFPNLVRTLWAWLDDGASTRLANTSRSPSTGCWMARSAGITRVGRGAGCDPVDQDARKFGLTLGFVRALLLVLVRRVIYVLMRQVTA